VNVIGALKERAGSPRRAPLRSALVVLQVALSLTLLVGATLLVRTLRHLSDIEVGYTTRTALLADIDLESQRYPPERGKLLQNELLERLRALPGVTGASATTFISPQPAGSQMNGVELDGLAGSADEVEFDFSRIDPTFFDVLGVPLLSGRGFTAHDVATGPPVAIINETMARRYWPNTNPIGRRIVLDAAANRTWEIVGVVGGGKYRSLRQTETAKVFRPLEQSYASWITLVVRTDGDPLRLGDAVRRELRALDPGIPLFDVRALEQHIAQASSEERMAAQVAGAFSLLALLLASLGIYGVLAYIVAQRRREIGIRMALGARPPEIVRLVVGRGLTLATIGVAAGIPAAMLSTRLLQALVFGVAPGDFTNYSVAVALLLAVAAIATFLPARRATAVDPLVTLRHGEE
jgi:putative ABC transport system permease protein